MLEKGGRYGNDDWHGVEPFCEKLGMYLGSRLSAILYLQVRGASQPEAVIPRALKHIFDAMPALSADYDVTLKARSPTLCSPLSIFLSYIIHI